ncbi:phage holin family protein [Saccharopolyspora sp. HNM0983]|uniref:Phage holin family protein n=1 Tax=Saccharopolyspora montiporae TaxID=2781240 RepID=A0A929FW25_9PSEU|nr:phage holin family protein [Saccharopolyspora sp. HNM0983]MBE9373086.1 phage holin family protein [Saccharopolyspora sp. HNM0983]
MTAADSEPTNDRSTPQLMGDLSERFNHLVRTEVQLARRELQDKGKQAGIGAGLIAGATAIGLLGGLLLVAVAVLALNLVLPAWAATLIVACVLLLAAGAAGHAGRAHLRRATPLRPDGFLTAVSQDYHDLSEAMRK